MRFEIRHPTHREEISSDSDFVVFGRDPACDIVIRNPRCSRRHASLRVVPEGFQVLDLASSNGVYVLGQKVDDAIIREGDVFSLGDVFVRVLPEDMPETLAMSRNDATVRQDAPPPFEPTVRRPLPPPIQHFPAKKEGAPPARGLLAPRVLGACSVAAGTTLVAASLALGPQIGIFRFVLPALGVLSAVAGLGSLGGFSFARGLNYAIFAVWTMTCLMAPYGVIGFAYQLRGEEHPDTDTFFAVVIGISGTIAVIALIIAAFLAKIYIPAPLPL